MKGGVSESAVERNLNKVTQGLKLTQEHKTKNTL